jgi:hypothetical protein
VAACGSGSPDFTVHGAPGVKSTGPWVWRDKRIMCDLLRAKAGLEGALGCACGGGGRSARRHTPACAGLRGSRHKRKVAKGRVRVRSAQAR